DSMRNGLRGRPTNSVATLEAQAARQIDVAESASVQLVDRFDLRTDRTALRAVLHDPPVLPGGAHELAPFPQVVRARLLDVDVFARLAGPDGDQRVPVIRGRDRHRIDAWILEEPPHIDERSRVAPDLASPLVEQRLIDVAQRGDLDVRHARKRVEVILPPSAETADGDPDAVVGAKYALRPRQERQAAEGARDSRRLCRGLEEV